MWTYQLRRGEWPRPRRSPRNETSCPRPGASRTRSKQQCWWSRELEEKIGRVNTNWGEPHYNHWWVCCHLITKDAFYTPGILCYPILPHNPQTSPVQSYGLKCIFIGNVEWNQRLRRYVLRNVQIINKRVNASESTKMGDNLYGKVTLKTALLELSNRLAQ